MQNGVDHLYHKQIPVNRQHVINNTNDGNYRGYRYSSSNNGCGCRGTISGSDSENFNITATYRRRSKIYNNQSIDCSKNISNIDNYILPKTNGACKYRSGSGEVGSASADSIASEDLLSSPAIDLVLDYSQTIEKNDVTLMTDQIPACSIDIRLEIKSDDIKSDYVVLDSRFIYVLDVCKDVIIHICNMKRWQRIEAIADLVHCLTPNEQRFFGSCIEAAVRPISSYARQNAEKFNQSSFIEKLIERESYENLINHAFSIISLINSSNRRSAHAFHSLLKQLIADFDEATKNFSKAKKDEIIDKLQLIVSTALNHPAYRLENKVELRFIRDKFFTYDSPQCISQDDQAFTPTTSSEDIPIVISRLDISDIDKAQNDVYSIKAEWSDNRISYLLKTADQISELHNKLLDQFPNEAGMKTEIPRLLPYLNRSHPKSILTYIRALPDLPARVLVSQIFRDFFYHSRLDSSSLTSPPQSLLLSNTPSDKPFTNTSQSLDFSSKTDLLYHSTSTFGLQNCNFSPLSVPVTSIAPSNNIILCATPLHVTTIPPQRTNIIPVTQPLQFPSAAYNYMHLLTLSTNVNGVACYNCAADHHGICCPKPHYSEIVASGKHFLHIIFYCDYKLDYDNAVNSEQLASDGTSVLAISSTSPLPSRSQSFSSPPPPSSSC
ncbi:unnamed protein product [Dracunculus medinensis]|uniref:SMAUG/ZCCHC2-like PHAT domain-containing protein n=1 Tax=Dracunculus medinensis TaxID=318479 RepID=A0A3P7QD24_DRAME|nr:unnamed protein product [Dracunculus medinensis]